MDDKRSGNIAQSVSQHLHPSRKQSSTRDEGKEEPEVSLLDQVKGDIGGYFGLDEESRSDLQVKKSMPTFEEGEEAFGSGKAVIDLERIDLPSNHFQVLDSAGEFLPPGAAAKGVGSHVDRWR